MCKARCCSIWVEVRQPLEVYFLFRTWIPYPTQVSGVSGESFPPASPCQPHVLSVNRGLCLLVPLACSLPGLEATANPRRRWVVLQGHHIFGIVSSSYCNTCVYLFIYLFNYSFFWSVILKVVEF